MTTGVKRAQERLTAIAQATNERLKPAIEPPADGDLTPWPRELTCAGRRGPSGSNGARTGVSNGGHDPRRTWLDSTIEERRACGNNGWVWRRRLNLLSRRRGAVSSRRLSGLTRFRGRGLTAQVIIAELGVDTQEHLPTRPYEQIKRRHGHNKAVVAVAH